MAEQLSSNELGNFLNSIQQAALKGYPNPQRNGCPEAQVLREVARTFAPFTHPAYEHIKTCSPCLEEMLELQGKAIRDEGAKVAKVRMHGILVGCVSICLVIALGVLYAMRHNAGESNQQIGRGVLPSQHTASMVAATTIPLDFRSVTARRGVAEGASAESVPVAPRKVVALAITLPFGSDDGTYSIEIRDPKNDSVLRSATGVARLLDGETRLTIPWIDLSDLAPSEYSFLYRHADANWRKAKLAIK